MKGIRGIFFITILLIGTLIAAGCTTSPTGPAPAAKNISSPATTTVPPAANAMESPVPARDLPENGSLFISFIPVTDICLGDTITFSGITNLPGGEDLTTRIFESRYKCTKCQKKNNSIEGCCGDQIPLNVPVKSGNGGLNTWSRRVNTSAYDFCPGDFQIDIGDPSRGIWNSSGFTVLKKPEPSRPWIAIDPISRHYLGDTITFRGTTNLEPGELITITISEPVIMCPKCQGRTDSVIGCCGDFNRTVVIREGVCGNNLWSLDVNTSDYDFLGDSDYWIGTSGRNSVAGNSSFFKVSAIPRPNLTLNLPENDTGGFALRFSGRSNTGNDPDEILLLTVFSDSGRGASFRVPVYANGTGYFWNFTVNKSAITPYNFLTVNVTSATSPAIRIERTFLYNNEPAYFPYNPVGP